MYDRFFSHSVSCQGVKSKDNCDQKHCFGFLAVFIKNSEAHSNAVSTVDSGEPFGLFTLMSAHYSEFQERTSEGQG